MSTVLRGAVIYVFLMVVFRLAGRRTLREITPFDIVLLLIISEAIQQAMLGGDNSLVNAGLLVVTLVGLDVLLSVLTYRFPALDRMVSGLPIIVVADGRIYEDRMRRLRVTEDEVMSAARELQGIARFEEIRYAVVENNGQITVIKRESE